jgi:hypothetical protein
MRYIVAITALLCSAAWAGDVAVSGAWTRATAPGQEGAALQFSIVSQKEAQLVAISSPLAGAAEIHSMTHDNGVMKMHAIDSLPLPAGKVVDMGAGGYHVMLLNLKAPLKAGEKMPFAVTVQFADKHKATVKAKAEVKPLTDGQDEHEHHH